MAGAEGPKISFKFGGAPPPEVAAYFRDKSLRPAFRWTEVWGEEHAHAFTVAKATQADVLKTIQDSLQRAIDGGVPYQAWAKALKPELEKAGWWGAKEMVDPATGESKPVQLGSPRRLKTIYDANLRTARAAGQWERAQRTKAALPFFVYELGPSMHHRPEHVAREGTIRPVDDALWDSWYPPNGWGCKCWLRQITRFEATAAGGETTVDPADLEPRGFTRILDDGSTRTVRVPKGIDPGWAGNPGRNRSRTLVQSLTGKLNAAGPLVAREAVDQLWRSGAAARLASTTSAPVTLPVAVVPPRQRQQLGAVAQVLELGTSTITRKLREHGATSVRATERGERPMGFEDFGRIQAILDQGETFRSDPEVTMAELNGKWWRLAIRRVKVGRQGDRLVVKSFYPDRVERRDRLREADRLLDLDEGADGGSLTPHGTK